MKYGYETTTRQCESDETTKLGLVLMEQYFVRRTLQFYTWQFLFKQSGSTSKTNKSDSVEGRHLSTLAFVTILIHSFNMKMPPSKETF